MRFLPTSDSLTAALSKTTADPSSYESSQNELPPGRQLATKKYTWDDLVDIIETKKDLSLLSRSADQQAVYWCYRQKIRLEWASIVDFLLHTKFAVEKKKVSLSLKADKKLSSPHHSAEEDDGDKLLVWAASKSLSEISNNFDKEEKAKMTVLCPNDFPYYFEDDIEHWCVWKLHEKVTEDDINQAERLLKTLDDSHGKILSTLHWINPPHLKSIPDIDHVHILCLRERI